MSREWTQRDYQKSWFTGNLKEGKNEAVPGKPGKMEYIYSHEWKWSKNGRMEQSKAMEYESRKASSDVLKPRNIYIYIYMIGVQMKSICISACLLTRTVAVTVLTSKSRHANKRYVFIWLIKLHFPAKFSNDKKCNMWSRSTLTITMVKINEPETRCKRLKTPTRVRFTLSAASPRLPIHHTLMMQ